MPECKTDFDCGSQEKCSSGTCIPACKLVSCGRNAQCVAQIHSARCVCLSGYFGDPYSICSTEVSPPPDVIVGCKSNRDCPDYTACENRKCINPCAERDPCASNAYCKVIGHQPVCTCPDGFIGDPRTSCTKRK